MHLKNRRVSLPEIVNFHDGVMKRRVPVRVKGVKFYARHDACVSSIYDLLFHHPWLARITNHKVVLGRSYQVRS